MQTTDAATATTSPTNGATSSISSAATLASDFDQFLTLLTAQVTNQDPTAPIDSTQFVEQLATFSALEQQVATNAHLESIITLLQDSLGEAGSSLLGEQVSVSQLSVQGQFSPLVVDAPDAEFGSLVVRSSTGAEVFRGDVSREWSWNGLDNFGQPVPAGDYRLAVLDADTGQEVPATAIATIDRVISTDDGQTVGFGENVSATNYDVS